LWFASPRGHTLSMPVVFLAGFALIAVGIICLCLSDEQVTGWWQRTLDAFGVGFITGGLVDVLAISMLNQFVTVEQGRRESYRESLPIWQNSDHAAAAEGAEKLLAKYEPGQFYPEVFDAMQEVIKHRPSAAPHGGLDFRSPKA
jgi:hypothetical protein